MSLSVLLIVYYLTYLWGEWYLFFLFLFALFTSRCFVSAHAVHHDALSPNAAIIVHTEHGVRVSPTNKSFLLVLNTAQLLLKLLLIIPLHSGQHLLLLELLLGESILIGGGEGWTLGCKAGEIHLVLSTHWLLLELL